MLNSVPLMCYILALTALSLSLFYLPMGMTIMNWSIYSPLSLTINLDIMLEWSSILYSSIIMFISGNVLKFSKFYMSLDQNNKRFTYMVILFITSMNLLIFIPNMVTLLIGWDGLGITSFLLIIYYSNHNSLGAGVLTMMVNRLGDMFLLLSIITTLKMSNWLPFHMLSDKTLVPQSLGIMIAAMTKSAQFPCSSWLPAAMAAPTPVSALVHSSTLVTAGIFLLYRFKLLIINSLAMQNILLVSGIITMIVAGLSASMEHDMKKVIALSTLSQLGLMSLCLGMTMFNLAFFHMICHAIFKALLFIAAGLSISMSNHNQDLRMYKQLSNHTPMTSSIMFISSMTMVGMPYLTGYYSKHMMMSWFPSSTMNLLLYMLFIMSIFLTSYYSSRLMLYSTSILTMMLPYSQHHISNDSNLSMWLMSTMSIIGASNIQWAFPIIPLYSSLMNNTHHLLMNLMILSAMIFSISSNKLTLAHRNKTLFSLSMYFLSLSFSSPIMSNWVPNIYMKLSLMLNKYLDQVWLEKIISLGPSLLMLNSSKMMNKNFYTSPQLNMLNSSTSFLLSYYLYSCM